jgi:hypothetical protein
MTAWAIDGCNWVMQEEMWQLAMLILCACALVWLKMKKPK